jgi:hypothetical protein
MANYGVEKQDPDSMRLEKVGFQDYNSWWRE